MKRPTAGKIALIGLGPRGLGALEALSQGAKSRPHPLHVDIFDACPEPGAGPNFDPQDPTHCLLNIPLRDIQLRAAAGLDVLPFTEWTPPAMGEDAFPPRADMGRYLQQRFQGLVGTSPLRVTRIPALVETLSQAGDGWHLSVGSHAHGPYDEVLICVGQPPIHPDAQLADWQRHASRTACDLLDAYPARRLQEAATAWAGRTVAVRGFALSSFDVIRMLTLGLGGTFSGDRYMPSGQEPACILPFSLDGKPPYPKPETGAVDARYEPTSQETDDFAKAVSRASVGSAAEARTLLTDALVAPVHRILSSLSPGTGETSIRDWLEREWADPGSQETGTARETLQQGIAMAEAGRPPSIGYAVGQLWRKWQDPLRQGYNPSATPPETAALIVGFDEGLKRYSYGPPVNACREVLALIRAGILSVDLAEDPEITLTDGGWHLRTGDHEVTAEVMIDGVLPAPDPRKVSASLVSGLIRDGHMSTLDDLGARTAPDGRLIDGNDDLVEGLSLLGRLALGSVIAADSLHDCFGEASSRWADGVLTRLR